MLLRRLLLVLSCALLLPAGASSGQVGGLPAEDGALQAAAATEVGEALGHPGYLIVTAAADSNAGFRWLDGPGPGQRSLTWLDGMLTVPESLALETFAGRDLAVPVEAAFAGAGAGGKLQWQDGNFTISEPILLTDGTVQLLASGGELEIVGTRIRYRRPEPQGTGGETDLRASLMMVAGIALLITVLLRRARRQMRKDA